MILQLDPPIPVDTDLGSGLAHIIIDYGPEHHVMWVVFLDEGGECWTLPNPRIRAQQNQTMGRNVDKSPTKYENANREGNTPWQTSPSPTSPPSLP